MIKKQDFKEILHSLGADLCGVAPIDRFDDAPKGFHPSDILPSCKSVISFACRFPIGTLRCKSDIPYTRVRNSMTPKLDAMALDFCIEMERHGVVCVPIPTNESICDTSTGRFRSIISQKHAAQAAGLGTIGRHSLLITPATPTGLLCPEASPERQISILQKKYQHCFSNISTKAAGLHRYAPDPQWCWLP